MKLKQQPEDFCVEELPIVSAESTGPFAFYRLEKKGWTTPDALAAVRRRWRIEERRVSFGGLKDRHAHTIQYLSIHNGPEKDLEHGGFALKYVGRLSEPYRADHFRANAFALVLRGLNADDIEQVATAIPEVREVGIANYFDDQRFGSVGADRSFVAREMVLGNFEGALRLALASPFEHDRAPAKKEKEILRHRWGEWSKCKAELSRGHAYDIVDYLVQHPTDFRGACARLRPELQGLYLSAWQSHLWNQMLSRWLAERLAVNQMMTIRLKTSAVVMPRELPTGLRRDWEELSLPLPSARLKFDPSMPYASIVAAVMSDAGVPLEQMRIQGLRKPFFSKGERLGRIPVANLTASSGEDELNRGRRKLELRFELPRGCYATMVVKRLTAKPQRPE